LSYDVNQALDPEEWDRVKYIQGKSINNNPNNIKDLKDIGKAA